MSGDWPPRPRASSRGRASDSISFVATLGPNGQVTRVITGGSGGPPPLPFGLPPFFGGGSGFGPAEHPIMRLLAPGVTATNPFAAMMQAALQGGIIGPMAGGDEAFEAQLARLFAAHQPQAQPTAASAIEKLEEVAVSQKEVDDKVACSVCMDELKLDEKVLKLPCSHLYHRDCLMPWLKQNHTCPVCRHPLPVEQNSSSGPTPADTPAPRSGSGAPPSQSFPMPFNSLFGRDDDEEEEYDEALNAAIRESLEEGLGPRQHAEFQTTREEQDVGLSGDDLRSVLIASLNDLSTPELQAECLSAGLTVPPEYANDRLYMRQLLKDKYVDGSPEHSTGATATASASASRPSSSTAAAATAPFAARVRVPAEPSLSEPDVFQLRLRFPDGSTLLRRFGYHDTLAQVVAYIISTPKRSLFQMDADGTPKCKLRGHNVGPYTCSDWNLTLPAAGLAPRAEVLVEKL